MLTESSTQLIPSSASSFFTLRGVCATPLAGKLCSLSVGPYLSFSLSHTALISLRDNLSPGEDVCLTSTVSITACRQRQRENPRLRPPRLLKKAPTYYSCGMFCVWKNINHHVLSSRRSHPTVLCDSDDWQSCVNNAALSVLAELQPCSPTRCACWWMLFSAVLSSLSSLSLLSLLALVLNKIQNSASEVNRSSVWGSHSSAVLYCFVIACFRISLEHVSVWPQMASVQGWSLSQPRSPPFLLFNSLIWSFFFLRLS